MISPTEQIQLLYEFSMSIGTSLDLNKMLTVSISTILRKMNCRAGGIHFLKDDNGCKSFKVVFSIPRDTSRIKEYQIAREKIPTKFGYEQLAQFRKEMPIHGQIEPDKHFYIIDLPGVGFFILLKNGKEIDTLFLKSMKTLFVKLATACQACIQSAAILDYQANLKGLIHEKSKKLVAKNLQLQEKITKLRQAEDDRERVISKLNKALEEIKTLQGIITICSNCKKICDDKGAWKQVETYIHEHTNAEFTHSICQECAKKLYPDWADEDGNL